MAPRPLLVTAATLLVGAAACDLGTTAHQLTADKAMVATLLNVPPRDVSASELFGTDGGTSSADAGVLTLPGQTLAFAFFGELEGQALDREPKPVTEAEVSVGPVDGERVALSNQGNGVYTAGSGDGGVGYVSGATYDFVARYEGREYVGRVEEVPLEERIAELRSGVVRLAAGSSLTLTRPEPPAGVERPLGFVTVLLLSEAGQPMGTTYTTLPTSALDLLRLGVRPGDFKKTQVVIPASAFPMARQNYLVTFQAAKLGGPRSENLNVVSLMLAGTADVGLVRVE